MVSGKLSHELEVNAPAGDVWAVFDGLKVAKLIEENLTQVIQKVDVLQGDGGVGTIVCLKFVPGNVNFYLSTCTIYNYYCSSIF